MPFLNSKIPQKYTLNSSSRLFVTTGGKIMDKTSGAKQSKRKEYREFLGNKREYGISLFNTEDGIRLIK
jgi:hypothetical protein